VSLRRAVRHSVFRGPPPRRRVVAHAGLSNCRANCLH